MSKYTTEVRYICENYAGEPESVGADQVDYVIMKAWSKVFGTRATFWEESYRPVLCSKILKHYYLREIGAETVGIWKLWMNTRLEEIMPYYNQLYKSAQLEFDPLKDVDYSRIYTRDTTGSSEDSSKTTGNRTDNSSGNVHTNVNSDGTSKDRYSDTPQGGLNGVESGSYLTNARIVDDAGSTVTESETTTGATSNFSDSSERNGSVTGEERYSENVTGKQGGKNYSEMLEDYRRTLLNIDMMVIDEFRDLFMQIW